MLLRIFQSAKHLPVAKDFFQKKKTADIQSAVLSHFSSTR